MFVYPFLHPADLECPPNPFVLDAKADRIPTDIGEKGDAAALAHNVAKSATMMWIFIFYNNEKQWMPHRASCVLMYSIEVWFGLTWCHGYLLRTILAPVS